MARLDRLGPAKEVAQIAAAIGRQFAHALLAAVAPGRRRRTRCRAGAADGSKLVFPQTRAIEPTYSFKHALTRDVAYESLLRARRQQLHERIARTLEERFPALAEAEPEILAYHFSRAGLHGAACLYSERAGDRALAPFGLRRGRRSFRRRARRSGPHAARGGPRPARARDSAQTRPGRHYLKVSAAPRSSRPICAPTRSPRAAGDDGALFTRRLGLVVLR